MADASSATHPELLALRTQIDGLDRELLTMLNRRASLAQQVGEVKKLEGSVAFRPEREAQVIDGLKLANPGPLKAESVAPIWREIMSACRALETPTRVAYLGPAGTLDLGALFTPVVQAVRHDTCIDDIEQLFPTTEPLLVRTAVIAALHRGLLLSDELQHKPWSRFTRVTRTPHRGPHAAQ